MPGLTQAAQRAELFTVKVANRQWVPRAFLSLERAPIVAVSRELKGLDSSEQLVFWLRRHDGLSGKTLEEAIEGGHLRRVLELARGFAEERGLHQGSVVA